ncbi:MAG: small multi-drug export protein [Planctomycetes bacterium]|nr:small multi-drug export protein [Planctomycetota bacterium]
MSIVKDKHAILLLAEQGEKDFPPIVRKIHFVLPLLATPALAGLIYVFKSPATMYSVISLGLTSLFGLGKFIILLPETAATEDSLGLRIYSRWHLAAMVTYMDFMTAFFLVHNLRFAYKIPFLGEKMEEFHDFGAYLLRTKPWFKKAAFAGVVLFVMFPLTGTGAIGGTIFGRLIGLRPYTVMSAITLGAIGGCGGIALLAQWLRDTFGGDIQKEWWFIALNAAVIVALIYGFGKMYQKMKREFRPLVQEVKAVQAEQTAAPVAEESKQSAAINTEIAGNSDSNA